MGRYVIGDIHGCREELVRLVESLPLAPSDQIIFLGDYVDRGPDSRGVIDYLIQLEQKSANELIFLKGNHEDMFLSYLGRAGRFGEAFLFNGGGLTLASYGLSERARGASALPAIPQSHLQFLERLRLYHLAEPFLCVHGGIHPLKRFEEQSEEEVLWIRDEFIFNRHLLPYTVIFGHTPRQEVFFDLPYKIGLDTGLVYGNLLSCLELEDKVLYQIRRGRKNVMRRDVRDQWGHFQPARSA
jgi:serine/threonine protein phosphatase 1